MKAKHPMTHKTYFFVNLCMPFGASISCAIFQAFSDALRHITMVLLRIKFLTIYLDDFLFMSWLKNRCNQALKGFISICDSIGCPILVEKTKWASELLVFLGILLDGRHRLLAIPSDKCNKALNLFKFAINQRKVTIRFIQSLTGTLNFMHKAIVPGRAFTRGMYTKFKTTDSRGNQLKQHHHIWLDSEFVRDCRVWVWFLENNRLQALCRPFEDFNPDKVIKILKFTLDALLNPKLAMGAVYNQQWVYAQWDADFIIQEKPSIEFLQLYTLVVGLKIWGNHEELINCRITIFCDNEAVVNMVNKLTSSCKQCMKVIHIVALDNLVKTRRVVVKHIRLEENILSDTLSCLDFQRFWKHAPKGMSDTPTECP